MGKDLPQITVIPGPCTAKDNKYFDLSNLANAESMIKTYFTFHCYDKYENKITKGGEKFISNAVLLKNGTVITIDSNVIDNNDGSYNIVFVPNIKGKYFNRKRKIW